MLSYHLFSLKNGLAGAVLILLAFSLVHVHVTGHYEGVYLLKLGGVRFELTDDVMLGEEDKVIFSMSWSALHKHLQPPAAYAHGAPLLDCEWFESDGSGFVRNIYPDGKMLLTCFSRFKDSDDKVTAGLFVGGGLPYHAHDHAAVSMNDTGMAFYDGRRWYHLWCNVNETIAIGSPSDLIPPSQWEFLGSTVIESTKDRVILSSSHQVTRDGALLRIDRYAVFSAGKPYFILVNNVRNEGGAPVSYYYVYGDEPWVGDYGTSRGDVGWVEDRLFPFEGAVDLGKYTYAGYVHSGNKAAGEKGTFSGLANFIEWLGVRPNVVYFSNNIGSFAPESAKHLLSSPDNRVLFLQWGPRVLRPGQSDRYVLAIGMAGNDQKTDFPVKPVVDPTMIGDVLWMDRR